jgi:hypothetical protein
MEAIGFGQSGAVQAAVEQITRHSLSIPERMKVDLSNTRLAVDLNRNFGSLAAVKMEMQGLGAIRAASEEFSRAFRQPPLFEALSLAHRASNESLASRLQVDTLIGKINGPWAKIGQELASTAALTNIARMSTAVRGTNPFGRTATGLLREELGDWRRSSPPVADLIDAGVRTAYYVERGYDRSLTDFPGDVVDQLIEIVAEDGGEQASDDELRADRAFGVLSRFERRLRDFISARLQAVFGDRWEVSQVPKPIIEAWRAKHQRDLDMRVAPRPRLIDYADFSDYHTLVVRRDNWRLAFAPVFPRKTDIEESLFRLAPVRIATMHSAFVTADDELILSLETKRVLTAIGLTK